MRITEQLRFTLVVLLFIFTLNMSMPQVALAAPIFSSGNENAQLVLRNTVPVDLLTQRFIDYEYKTENPVIKNSITVIATAYSSEPEQTDSTPCITASGMDVCAHGEEDVIAANFLRFNTKIRIPEIYGNKIFTVQDRMHPRFSHRIDLWKLSRNSAITFGKRLVKIEVLAE